MTAYLKFKGDLQAIVKLETGKVTNYFLDLVVEAATCKAQNSGIVAVNYLLDSETSLQRLTIVGGNEQNEIKTRIRRQHNGKCMGRREKIEQVPLNNGEHTFSKKDDRLAYRPEITRINGKMDSKTTPNRNAFDIQIEITQTNRYCSSLT
ncbi:hypothetical protein ALC56_07042 [Trachymyrmex septentrionalis]|uniref:Uncharacterized protein n=1 Tax=Trachymyrmex septentrionalis TaxID=34720 RepID=A0A195FEU6_9HYME|nr:hypothetical protein ALC56_07042 [Trachymyrmex septentrionalis]